MLSEKRQLARDAPGAGDLAVRAARPEDAEAIASIYNEGIEERGATFETRPRSSEEVERRICSDEGSVLVGEQGGRVLGWAGVDSYSDRCVYAGVGECAVYVAQRARGRRVGGALLEALATDAERRGYYKLVGKVLTDNEASIHLLHRCGFRDVGVHRRHGKLDGEWRDVLVVERLLGDAARG